MSDIYEEHLGWNEQPEGRFCGWGIAPVIEGSLSREAP
jgi:hypothetical protein